MKNPITIISAIVLFMTPMVCGADSVEEIGLSTASNGRLAYHPDAQGNRIPDFSHCGYMGGDRGIPDVPNRVVVSPVRGDNTERIQAAIDYVDGLEPDENGFRGAVLLLKGQFEVFGSLRLSVSGVVLRGQGVNPGGTVLVAAGRDRRTLIHIVGRDDLSSGTSRFHKIVDDCVPVGATTLRLDSTEGLAVGDTMNIIRPSTEAWIQELDMASFAGGLGGWKGWKPGSRDLTWDRVIKAIDGQQIVLDAPITTAIEAQYGGGLVQPYSWDGRISHLGVENLRCESVFDANNPKDEAHCWTAITMENVENAWVRQVTMAYFAGSAVAIWKSTKKITVQDCISTAPVSEIGGYRRHTFFTMGQQTMFLRCVAEQGRHDFSVGHCAAGPNAFVQCEAALTLADSGPIESWAGGVLYDNISIDRGALRLCNWGGKTDGVGWSAANSVLWQCNASVIQVENPPTARNWAFGCWGEFEGDGIWSESNSFVRPASLYQAQLIERLGAQDAEYFRLMPMSMSSTSSPTIEQAAEMTQDARRPALQLADYIADAGRYDPVLTDPDGIPRLENVSPARRSASPETKGASLSVSNGWLTCGDTLLTGGRRGVVWWRGNIRPQEAASFGYGVTRFVPSRIGPGFTDDLGELTDDMLSSRQVVLDHNYGLWYDRRRDDHERVRRIDGNVVPPFYEMPFARSGQGTAWDGLSRYDLTKYNVWYWSRLEEFAGLCDTKGLVLLHQNYFQHHILEAGAHWADFPWRPANNINDTGFPEPPPYAGNKRIFMDEQFYDVNHPVRRELHRAYIRKCLDNFADNTNVIQFTSAEFTGPVEFVRFWLDTIIEWKRETGRNPLIALSCTKDVQDAILDDPDRCRHVSVIDIRYWWYEAAGRLYAPEGGKHLAPRQHARLLKPRGTSFSQVVHAVRQYRRKHPDKAVIYSADDKYGWAVLMGGGSIPNLPATTDRALMESIADMLPFDLPGNPRDQYALAAPGRSYLVYATSGDKIQLDLTGVEGTLHVRWIDPGSAKIVSGGGSIAGNQKVEMATKSKPCLLWLTRKR